LHPLTEVLRERGWTNRALARATGYSEQLISQVLRGLARPSSRFRAACADALNVPEESLFRFETIRRPALAGSGDDG
jgi:transcriptional regulator with XRE-family HTH domain